MIPEIGLEEVRDINLSQGGLFVKFEQIGREVNVYQDTSDNFKSAPMAKGGAKPTAPVVTKAPVSSPAKSTVTSAPKSGGDDVYEQLEKLASLRDKGILTNEEFTQKKKQLLGL
jgi:hypothetical protein